MAKQKTSQKFVYKLHSSILEKTDWDLKLPLKKAIAHKTDIITLADSQCLRFIDEINGINTEVQAKEKKKIIKALKRKEDLKSKNEVRKLYYDLYKMQFRQDYVCIIMDKVSHYDKLNKGFYINNIHYRRFLGTNGGIKNSTIIYVSDGHKTDKKYNGVYHDLKKKLDCGRDKSVPIIPAKLEAYQALICSGSVPVSMPKGIIVVPDCITKFKSDVINIDDTLSDEPIVETITKDIELIDSDGYGFMLPSLSKRWNKELGGNENEYLSGVNTRGLPWTKGMLFTFDFIEFGEKIANNYMVKDVWGDYRDVRDAEVILTEGMLKLWSSYSSYEDYMENVEKYNYTFAVSKTAPMQLENERSTNYQFLQSYELTEKDIEELTSHTVNEIQEVIGLDYNKTILFLNGENINPDNIPDDYKKALMIDKRMINDPFVRSVVYNSIKKKIRQAKIGVLKVHGNYAIICGDPYSLAQSMFGLKVTGLLKKGECYHKYWTDENVDEIVCFRAPMTSHNNIRKLNVAATDEMKHWYQYINTCCCLNSWDTTCEALNGADKDKSHCPCKTW